MTVIQLPKQGEPLVYGSTALVSGWGYRRQGDRLSVADVLHYTTMTVFEDEICSLTYQEWLKGSMFCSGVKGGGKDACQGWLYRISSLSFFFVSSELYFRISYVLFFPSSHSFLSFSCAPDLPFSRRLRWPTYNARRSNRHHFMGCWMCW